MKPVETVKSGSNALPAAERVAEAQGYEQSSGSSGAPGLSRTPGVHRSWSSSAHSDVPPDLIVSSADSIIFYVHRDRILAASTNGVNGKLSPPLTARPSNDDTHIQPILRVDLPYPSVVVNLLFIAVYKKLEDDSIQAEVPSLMILSSTIRALVECGIPLKTFVSKSSAIFVLLSSYCPDSALAVYTLAASHAPDLDHLAVHASQFLLSLEFAQITDIMAKTMGSSYLRRLYVLQTERTREFKRLLVAPPQLHVQAEQCDCKALQNAWRIATAHLVWAASPGIMGAVIDNTKSSVTDGVQCEQCKASLEGRFEDLKHAWSLVKNTI